MLASLQAEGAFEEIGEEGIQDLGARSRLDHVGGLSQHPRPVRYGPGLPPGSIARTSGWRPAHTLWVGSPGSKAFETGWSQALLATTVRVRLNLSAGGGEFTT